MIGRTLSVILLFSTVAISCISQERVPDSAKDIASPSLSAEPYLLDTGLVSRSISFENPAGAAGAGGKAASNLGVGRKGAPMRNIEPHEEILLCDIAGPGVIRHIWMTTRRDPLNLRSLVIRAYWEGQEHPSVECPLGDFMGFAHGWVMPYQSRVHSVGENAGMNIWLPMPFVSTARLTLENEGETAVPLFYQVDYTLGEDLGEGIGRLHTLFLRENPTNLTEDFTILPERNGKGRFIGTVLGIRYDDSRWWGEGEIKIFMDGDTEYPTICGTGSEDYVGLSYGMQQTPFLFNGCSLNDTENQYVSMYRWHMLDPVYWKEACRIKIQQIGWSSEQREKTGSGLYERQDDWSAATFWYEPVPSAPLPPFPGLVQRTADLLDR